MNILIGVIIMTKTEKEMMKKFNRLSEKDKVIYLNLLPEQKALHPTVQERASDHFHQVT